MIKLLIKILQLNSNGNSRSNKQSCTRPPTCLNEAVPNPQSRQIETECSLHLRPGPYRDFGPSGLLQHSCPRLYIKINRYANEVMLIQKKVKMYLNFSFKKLYHLCIWKSSTADQTKRTKLIPTTLLKYQHWNRVKSTEYLHITSNTDTIATWTEQQGNMGYKA